MTSLTVMVAMSAPPHLVGGVIGLAVNKLAGALALTALVVALVQLPRLTRLYVAARAISTARPHVGPLADERELAGQVVVGGALGQLSHCYRLS